MSKKPTFYDLRASEERMLSDWRNKKLPYKKLKPKKTVKVKKRTEINHAKGLNYTQFINSDYWKKVRFKVLKRDKFECTVCHTKNNLRVHHTTYKHHGFEHKYLNELMTLCNDCHKITHGIVTEKIPDNF